MQASCTEASPAIHRGLQIKISGRNHADLCSAFQWVCCVLQGQHAGALCRCASRRRQGALERSEETLRAHCPHCSGAGGHCRGQLGPPPCRQGESLHASGVSLGGGQCQLASSCPTCVHLPPASLCLAALRISLALVLLAAPVALSSYNVCVHEISPQEASVNAASNGGVEMMPVVQPGLLDARRSLEMLGQEVRRDAGSDVLCFRAALGRL